MNSKIFLTEGLYRETNTRNGRWVMEEISQQPSPGTSSGRGKILTGVFAGEGESVKDCEAFSKFLAAGFELYHVGINTHPAVVIQKMKRFSPQVLILLCQGNVDAMKELIEVIKREQLRSMVRIVLYGPSIGESVRDEVHADAFAESEQDLFDMVSEMVRESLL